MGKMKIITITIFLMISLILVSSCSVFEKNPPPEIQSKEEIESDDYANITNKYSSLVKAYNNKVKEYNNLNKKYNSVIDRRNYYQDKYEYLTDLNMICRGQEISIPQLRTLHKKTFCNDGCDYGLYCTMSMKPFFDCTDKLTFYINVYEEDIEICDIIAFETPNNPKNHWTIHQVIKIDNKGYTTKCFSCTGFDDYIVQFDDIKGKLMSVEYG